MDMALELVDTSLDAITSIRRLQKHSINWLMKLGGR
nr:MAG TPA: hypothetical protein [Caudoviricetes sp.]